LPHKARNDRRHAGDFAAVKLEAIQLLGIQDSLSFYISQITSVRNAIRSNIEQGLTPVVDYSILYRAVEIDAAVREWRSPLPQNDLSDLVYLLYKQMLWIYLADYLSIQIYFLGTRPQITSAVKDGVALLE
jgi:hypothetical protein